MGELDFRLVALLGDVKANRRAHPLGLVLNIVHVVLENHPRDLFVRATLDDPELGIVDVLDAIRELVADIGVTTFDVFAPPSTNVVDGREGFLRDWSTTGEVLRVVNGSLLPSDFARDCLVVMACFAAVPGRGRMLVDQRFFAILPPLF